jgi:peptidoglycan hydrolase-like protein with peptidoglycan-binding domain
MNKIFNLSKNTLRTGLLFSGTIMAIFVFSFFGIQSASATITSTLDLGSTGSEVTELQTYLATNPSVYPSGLVTGYFGQLTKAGVERFQADQGIVSSGTPATTGYGRVGPVTLAALNQKMNGYVGGDKTSPVIQSLNVSASNTSVNMNWYTNENSAAIVYYSTSSIPMTEASPTKGVYIGGTSVLVSTNLQTAHSTTIVGLTPNTYYNYVVYVRDGSGNESITWPSSFRTSN